MRVGPRQRCLRCAHDNSESCSDSAGPNQGAHKLRAALWQDPFAVPHTILSGQVRHARPVARRGRLVTVRQEVSVRIRPRSETAAMCLTSAKYNGQCPQSLTDLEIKRYVRVTLMPEAR